MIDLSIIVAVYNEDPRNLLMLLERLWKAISPTGLTFEVVFVNDGSKAATSNALKQIVGQVDYVKLVVLSRNFGQQAAITAGMDHASGSAIVNIDSDMQDPPELIPEMVQFWRDGYDVVYAQRSTRRDRVGKRLPAYIFYRALGAVSSVKIPWDTGDFRLLDRKVVTALQSLPEKTRFLRGLIPWLGFRQIGIPIDRDARSMGKSTYTLRKLMMLAIDGLLSFSVMPLYMVAILGLTVMAIGLIMLLGGSLLGQIQSAEQALILGVVIVAGLQIFCTGLVAMYLSKVLDEVRSRPTYLVSELIGTPFANDHDLSAAKQAEARSAR